MFIDVTLSPLEETVWLSLDDMALLFDRDRSALENTSAV